MAKIIFKWRYLKAGKNGKRSENLIRYIATREGVEKLDDSWKLLPATQIQKETVRKLLSDFPDTKDTFEYLDYEKAATRGAASEFIAHAVEEKMDLIGQRETYMKYIATRPRVEKTGSHGLFTDSDVPIRLSAVAKEVANHPGIVFTEILSLRREDAERLGYGRGTAWRDLLRSQTRVMAEAMKIPLTDLKWYAAFHNESHHPHVHIVAYSTGREPYMTEQGLKRLKSAFAREIFKQDLLPVYAAQIANRNALVRESRDSLTEIVEKIRTEGYANDAVERMMRELSITLSRLKGKKVYAYLPQNAKDLVCAIVEELARDERISALYDLWYSQREEVIRTYTDELPERVPLSENREFRSVLNAVIREAERLTEQSGVGYDATEKAMRDASPASALRLLRQVSRVFETKIDGNRPAGYEHIDRKLLSEIAEKKLAHGQKLG